MTKTTKKQAYETPITEALELRFEGALMDASPFFGGTGFPGGDPGLDDDKYNYGGF